MSVTMALDARSRASIYEALSPLIGEHNANDLMSEFPSIEADELVTKHFLRAELAERFHRQTVWVVATVGAAFATSTAILGTLISVQ
jgi:hypothetical protein